VVFLVAYIWWPWRYELGNNPNDYYTAILGISLALSLLSLGLAIFGVGITILVFTALWIAGKS